MVSPGSSRLGLEHSSDEFIAVGALQLPVTPPSPFALDMYMYICQRDDA